MLNVAFYARVSTDKQSQADTIRSQIEALENKIQSDGYPLLGELKFIDNGYSGSTLIRPGLEQLRDKVFGGEIDKIYIHSPDRLSRKYVHQIILLEEFQKSGVEVIFLNHPIEANPECHLLLQMQGMIAEYERSKITERHRRGRIYAAKRGLVNALSGAPYGYRYIDKHTGGGQAFYEICEEEAEIVRKLFSWVGQERISLGEAWRRINQMKLLTRTGKTYWNRSVIWGILKNPAYKGQAAFGKRKSGEIAPRVRPQKRSSEQPKWNYSLYRTEKENWIYIPVPALIDEDLFEVVQEQLEENKKRMRVLREKARNLLQGLVVCQQCHYAYYAKSKGKSTGDMQTHYSYYRCSGTNKERFGEVETCKNKPIRQEILEAAVWEEVKKLLKEPHRIFEEYQRRLSRLNDSPEEASMRALEKQLDKFTRSLSRLVDIYIQEQINQEEFIKKNKIIKQKIEKLEEQKKKIVQHKTVKKELQLIVTRLEDFKTLIENHLEQVNWHSKQSIIRAIVKRVEIDKEEVNIVFRVPELTSYLNDQELSKQKNRQHCWQSI